MPLSDAEALAARIVAESGDAVMFVDREGVVRLWNRAAEEMFGFPAAEMVGASMDPIVPERLRARHWEGWDKVMASGVTRYGKDVLAVPALRKDGSTLSIEFTIALLRDGSGAVAGAAAIVRDVTQRFGREKALRARLKELEAKTRG
ncbi:MAG TPA: PAS domain S-box protein [Anaeromyxobacteraceae bacterium]|nr:PAS domain S-box protein [Anaeromyxobacteraceae bacterium]